jgi:hypothetical protein
VNRPNQVAHPPLKVQFKNQVHHPHPHHLKVLPHHLKVLPHHLKTQEKIQSLDLDLNKRKDLMEKE